MLISMLLLAFVLVLMLMFLLMLFEFVACSYGYGFVCVCSHRSCVDCCAMLMFVMCVLFGSVMRCYVLFVTCWLGLLCVVLSCVVCVISFVVFGEVVCCCVFVMMRYVLFGL